MVIIQRAIKPRSPSGGRLKENRSKRKYEKGSRPTLPHVKETRTDTRKQKGGSHKLYLTTVNTVNILNPKTKKIEKATIKSVESNPASRHYARRNILNKGAIIETDKGKARITNRPGQEAIVNAVLVE